MQTFVQTCVDFEVVHLPIYPHGSEIDIQETPTLMQQICIYAMDTHLAIVLQVASLASAPAHLYLTLWYAPSVVPFLWLLRYSFARF